MSVMPNSSRTTQARDCCNALVSDHACYIIDFEHVEMIVDLPVPRRASGPWLSVLLQHRASGASGHRSASACPSACPGTLPPCSGYLRAAFGFSVPSRGREGATLRVDSHMPGRSSVGMRTAHQRRTVLRRDGHSIDHRNRRSRRTKDDGPQGGIPSR